MAELIGLRNEEPFGSKPVGKALSPGPHGSGESSAEELTRTDILHRMIDCPDTKARG